jgi:hypothetical protein
MNKVKFANLFLFAVCLGAIGVAGSAGAQSVRHDVMDAQSARADIIRLKEERSMARSNHNWGKVRQDNRLIAADRHFLHQDKRKIQNSG